MLLRGRRSAIRRRLIVRMILLISANYKAIINRAGVIRVVVLKKKDKKRRESNIGAVGRIVVFDGSQYVLAWLEKFELACRIDDMCVQF